MTVVTGPVFGLTVPCGYAERADIRAYALAQHAEATRALLHGHSEGNAAKLTAADAWLNDLDATEDEARRRDLCPT